MNLLRNVIIFLPRSGRLEIVIFENFLVVEEMEEIAVEWDHEDFPIVAGYDFTISSCDL